MSATPETMAAGPLAREQDLWRLAVELLGYRSAGHARFRCQQTFAGVPLAGRDVLEIGAGAGLHSAYAAVRGARRVVALEPEADGGRTGTRSTLRTLKEALGLASLEVVPRTIQAYAHQGRRFDVVLLANSVNHLDEPACVELHRSADARARYRAVLRHVAGMLAPGALLILADCSRLNLWPMLGLRNPFNPSIEWHKHQPPHVWDALLASEGFEAVASSWYRYYPLRWLGALGSNAAAAFVLASHFRLVRRWAPPAGGGGA